ncbi:MULTISPECIES: hypothetical protein [Candidatus Ichthyocystis]|uniref:Putative membrane protein n=1 Tax=Candidatus Ichthyocystis hellenicum TaxID=1561003 RepID=A0A0S4M7G7_9BURK|nr:MULTISPECIES: hypothetical protein [Ichthyocystis]CUT18230.1 putative membrane protein [Candidatus Ichthyocystis hellenicum]
MNTDKNCGIGSECLNISSVYFKDINKYILGMIPGNDIIIDNFGLNSMDKEPVGVISLFLSLIFLLGIVVNFVLGKCRSSSWCRTTVNSMKDKISKLRMRIDYRF